MKPIAKCWNFIGISQCNRGSSELHTTLRFVYIWANVDVSNCQNRAPYKWRRPVHSVRFAFIHNLCFVVCVLFRLFLSLFVCFFVTEIMTISCNQRSNKNWADLPFYGRLKWFPTVFEWNCSRTSSKLAIIGVEFQSEWLRVCVIFCVCRAIRSNVRWKRIVEVVCWCVVWHDILLEPSVVHRIRKRQPHHWNLSLSESLFDARLIFFLYIIDEV